MPASRRKRAPRDERSGASAAGRAGDRGGGDSISDSLRDYTRAVGGGLIVGLPLLFTMEVWWHGFLLPRWELLVLFGLSFLIVLGYNMVGGFRRERTLVQLVLDSVSTMGLGIVVALVALVVLGRIDGATSLRDAAGKVTLEAIPIAFGASVASAQLSGEGGAGGKGGDRPGALVRLVVGAGGALLFALNVAPTEEPLILGLEATPWLLLAVIAASLLLTFALAFYADFAGRGGQRGDGVLDHPIAETLTAYTLSVVVALVLLWAFGRLDGVGLAPIVGMTVMLAVVASIGAAIGRLLVSGGESPEAEA